MGANGGLGKLTCFGWVFHLSGAIGIFCLVLTNVIVADVWRRHNGYLQQVETTKEVVVRPETDAQPIQTVNQLQVTRLKQW